MGRALLRARPRNGEATLELPDCAPARGRAPAGGIPARPELRRRPHHVERVVPARGRLAAGPRDLRRGGHALPVAGDRRHRGLAPRLHGPTPGARPSPPPPGAPPPLPPPPGG